ncbi:MAG: AAA family ATPase [Saprospiraceae bacterium]
MTERVERNSNVLILLKSFPILHKIKFVAIMRITEIRIEGLFDMFDHTIQLNQEEHLTVIYGINGIGKTMIFRILDCFYNGDFEELVELPFKKLNLTFSNGDALECSKMQFRTKTTLLFSMNEQIVYVPKRDEPLDFNLAKQKVFGTIDKLPIYFISTDRLRFLESIQYESGKISTLTTSNRLNYYSKKIARDIRMINNEYLKLSEQLELSLSKRLIQKQIRRNITYDELISIKEQVEKRINQLQKIALINNDMEVGFELSETMDEIEQTLIAANLSDFQIKLTVFDDYYDKLMLFLDILNNRRLRYKTISINNYSEIEYQRTRYNKLTEFDGFQFINSKGRKLKSDQLSTGEQHAIIMFYSLLFEVPENALVLIDEPENSLHIVWQKAYLNDIKDIIALRGFDVIIATHSPSIINGEWDLTVSLKGIEEVAYV